MSMKSGPAKTNLSNFQGFGFKANKGVGSAAAKPAQGSQVPKRSPGGGAASVFKEALDEEDGVGKKTLASLPSWSKLSVEARQAQRQAETLQAEDPTVFQYDEVFEEIRQDSETDHPSQLVHTNVLEQKKRVGLTVMQGAEAVKSGSKRQAKYIEKVIVATDRRRVEQQIIEDRALKKEKDQRKDAETFVTGAFKEELKRRKKFEEELEMQELRDTMKAAEKQEDGKGFADMYRNLLNTGLASSRGGEKVREQAAPREDPVEVKREPVEDKMEDDLAAAPVKEEDEVKVKEEKVKEEESEQEPPAAGAALPANTAAQASAATPAGAAASAEPATATERRERALSARERYLARKRAPADT